MKKIFVSAFVNSNFGDDLMLKLLFERYRDIAFYIKVKDTKYKSNYEKYTNVTIVNNRFKVKKELIDIYLTIGGSMYQISNFKQYLLRIKRILKLILYRLNGIKLVTLGINLGPFKSRIGEYISYLELVQNDLITVRDSISYDTLRKYKSIKNLYLKDDIVYNYKPDNIKKSNAIGISVYNSENQIINKSYQNFLEKVIEYVFKNLNVRIKLFSFNTGKASDLLLANSLILKYNDERLESIGYSGDIDSFITQISTCDWFISTRFHSHILADILHIPFIPIIYSNKSSWFLLDKKYNGISLFINDLDTQTDIKRIVDSLINNINVFSQFSHNTIDHFFELDNYISYGK